VPQEKLLKLLGHLQKPQTKDQQPKHASSNEIGIGLDACMQPIPNSDLNLVQTTDYFYPLVNDPYRMGWIACNNVISDLYAMGVTRIDNVLMLLATSIKFTVDEEDIVIPLIMSGFRDCCLAAGTEIRGGQTAKNPWVLLGGCATSVLPMASLVMPNQAVEGDVLILTKPLGIRVAVNLNQWLDTKPERIEQLSIDRETIKKAYNDCIVAMMTLNKNAAELMNKHGAHGATDVTGFGILGHAQNLAECQREEVDFELNSLPFLQHMVKADKEAGNVFKVTNGYAAETSGGLLLAMPAEKVSMFRDELKQLDGHDSWVVGRVVKGTRNARLSDDLKLVEVAADERDRLITV